MPGSCLPSTMTDHFVNPGDDGEEHIRTPCRGSASHSTSAPVPFCPDAPMTTRASRRAPRNDSNFDPPILPDLDPLRSKCVHDLTLPRKHRQGLGLAPDAAWHGEPESGQERVAQSRVGCHHKETITAREVHRARARKRTGHARTAEDLRPPLDADREDRLS